jgi:hypothetical protein
VKRIFTKVKYGSAKQIVIRGKQEVVFIEDLAVAFLLNIFNEYIRHSIINDETAIIRQPTYKIIFRLLDDNRCYILVAF